MYIVDGAAIALAYDARRATRDIDAAFEPKMLVYEAAADVAARLHLPPGWLNDAVRGFVVGDDPAEDVFGDRLDVAARFFVEEIFSASG
jgi:hypothetical protein